MENFFCFLYTELTETKWWSLNHETREMIFHFVHLLMIKNYLVSCISIKQELLFNEMSTMTRLTWMWNYKNIRTSFFRDARWTFTSLWRWYMSVRSLLIRYYKSTSFLLQPPQFFQVESYVTLQWTLVMKSQVSS